MTRLVALAALVLAAAAPAAAGVDRGSILPGKGLTTVKLGTRTDEARKALGKPTAVAGRAWNWDGKQVRVTVRFDTSGYADRVQAHALAAAVTATCTTNGVCLGEPKGLARLKSLYGAGLKAVKMGNSTVWVLAGKSVTGHRVYTSFASFPGTSRIKTIAVGYCYDTTLC